MRGRMSESMFVRLVYHWTYMAVINSEATYKSQEVLNGIEYTKPTFRSKIEVPVCKEIFKRV